MEQYELIQLISELVESKVGEMDYREWWMVEKQKNCEMGFNMGDGKMMIIEIQIVEEEIDNEVK